MVDQTVILCWLELVSDNPETAVLDDRSVPPRRDAQPSAKYM